MSVCCVCVCIHALGSFMCVCVAVAVVVATAPHYQPRLDWYVRVCVAFVYVFMC